MSFTSLSFLLLFPLLITYFVFMHCFYSILSKIDQILLISPSANVCVFGDFNIHHKDWLTYSGGNDQPDELCYYFSTSNDLTQVVDFPTQILTVLLFWISFFLLMLVFVTPETLKYWTGDQWGQSYLMVRRCLFSLGWPPF